MKRFSFRRAGRTASVLAVLFVAGCGARSRQAAPARAPASEPASGAPAEEGVRAEQAPGSPSADKALEQPAPAAPAAGSAFPGSTKGTGSGEPPDEIEALSRRLEGALTLSVPDCTSAWSLRDRICDLADRICDLAGRSAERDVAERCADGRTRCERATSRVRESCGR